MERRGAPLHPNLTRATEKPRQENLPWLMVDLVSAL